MQVSSGRHIGEAHETARNYKGHFGEDIVIEGYQTVYSHRDTFELSRVGVEELKSELIAAQRSVVRLQQQLLDFQEKLLNTQTEQLQGMSTVVDTAVDKGIRSYNQALSRTIKDSVPVLSEKTLKKVVVDFSFCYLSVISFAITAILLDIASVITITRHGQCSLC